MDLHIPQLPHPTILSAAFQLLLPLKRNQENSKGLWTGEKRVNENDNSTLRINMPCSVLQQKDPGFLEIYDIPRAFTRQRDPAERS